MHAARGKRLPEWSGSFDLSNRRGIGLRVTGDGSGALLAFMIAGRDYVIPIDFVGPRDIEIPNGEVAWSMSAWGWRMATKHANYASRRSCRLGFGYLPPKSKTSIVIQRLAALAEIPARLENPVIRADQGTLTVHGTVKSGQYLQYDGGDLATVFDENWNKLRDLRIVKDNYMMPAGWGPVSIESSSKTKLWLEVQFMTEGGPVIVPLR